MVDLQTILDILDKGGTFALIVLIAFGLHKRYWVPGWVHEAVVQRNITLETLLSNNAARVEAKLERYEAGLWSGKGGSNEPS